MINPKTPVDFSLYKEQATEARRLKALAAESFIPDDPEDLAVWKALASKYGVRLPSYTQPWTEVKYLKRIMTKLGVEMKDYLEVCGSSTLKGLAKLNPNRPARFEIGLFLEWYDEKECGKHE